MTWSLQLVSGDLNYSGPGGFSVVTGSAKLFQDLKDWILEPEGSDPMHLGYGSLIDGGVASDGTVTPSSIGQILTGLQLSTIESEIRRICNALQQQQQARISQEQLQYGGKNTYSLGEVLLSVDNVNITQAGDTALITVSITTGDGNSLSFTQPIS